MFWFYIFEDERFTRWILLTEDHGGENYTVDLAQTLLYFQLFPLYYETENGFLMMFQDKCGFRIRFNFSEVVYKQSQRIAMQRKEFDLFDTFFSISIWEKSDCPCKRMWGSMSNIYILYIFSCQPDVTSWLQTCTFSCLKIYKKKIKISQHVLY